MSAIIKLKDRDNTSERTNAQIITVPQFDSRITNPSTLTPERIRIIRKDATISFLRQVLVAPAFHTPWTIKAKKNAPTKARAFIEDVIFLHRNHIIQSGFYGALDFGWMPYEIVYQIVNGKVIIEKFKSLLHDFTQILVYIDTGDFAGFINNDMYGNEIIIREHNAQLINLEVEGTNWYGRSVSEVTDALVTNWTTVNNAADRYDKKTAGSHWVVYYPVGKTLYEGTETDNDKIARTLLNNLESSGAIAIPDEVQEWLDDDIDRDYKGKWRVELLSDTGNASRTFIDRLKYLDNLKARAFGLPERSVLEGKFGTKAEAETHTDIGLATIDTKHQLIIDQINKQAINQLLILNWGEKAKGTVYIDKAPLVDSRFSTLKEIYRLIIQSPETIISETQQINLKALRDELAIPSVTNDE